MIAQIEQAGFLAAEEGEGLGIARQADLGRMGSASMAAPLVMDLDWKVLLGTLREFWVRLCVLP